MRLIIYDWLLVSVTNLCNQLVITQNKFLLSREHDFLYLLFGVWQFQGPLLEIFTANIGIYIYMLVKLWCGVSLSASVNAVRINVAYLSK